jgi:inorganic triphosphatase YgiF
MAKARDIPGLEAELSYRAAAARTVAVRADELFDHARGVLDTSEIERVHDMRVATRRLRAVLEIYEPCFPRKQLRPVLAHVKTLADALGERRDPDVQLAQLDEFASAVKPADRPGVAVFAERVRSEQGTANRMLASALAELEETDLRGRLAALAASAAPDTEAARASAALDTQAASASAAPDTQAAAARAAPDTQAAAARAAPDTQAAAARAAPDTRPAAGSAASDPQAAAGSAASDTQPAAGAAPETAGATAFESLQPTEGDDRYQDPGRGGHTEVTPP